MPKKTDPKVKERCVRQVLEHQGEYSSLTAAAAVVARREGLGKETVRRWVVQAQIDGGQRQGRPARSWPRSRTSRPRSAGWRRTTRASAGHRCSSRGNSPPATVDRGVHRRDEGRGVRGRVDLPGAAGAGCQVAARTYRSRRQPSRQVADRTVSDALVTDMVRDIAWTLDREGRRRLTPEGLYGRRKMTALVRRRLPDASPGSVDRAMSTLGLQGIRRSKGIRTTIPAQNGTRAGDLLDRDFTADAPNRTWVMDFERHEALLNRVEVRDLHRCAVAPAFRS